MSFPVPNPATLTLTLNPKPNPKPSPEPHRKLNPLLTITLTVILTLWLAGRRLADGTMLYGCTCNLSVDLTACDQDFDVSFTGVRRFDTQICLCAWH